MYVAATTDVDTMLTGYLLILHCHTNQHSMGIQTTLESS